jgi:hypothetical protein
MNNENLEKRKLNAVRYYLVAGIVESVAALILLLLIPADAKNAWLFGFSKTRLGMAGVLLFAVLIFLWLSAVSYRNQSRIEKFIYGLSTFFRKYGGFFEFWVISFGAILFGAYIYLYLKTPNLTTARGILIRLSPFILLAFTRTVQTLIVYYWAGFRQREKRAVAHSGEDRLIVISPNKVALILFTIAGIFVLTTVASDVIARTTWNINFGTELNLFHENNLPTLFSALLLVSSAILLAVIAELKGRKNKDPFRGWWVVLSVIFMYLSIDEAASLHERMEVFIKRMIDPGGIFFFTWVIPGIVFTVLFSLFFIRFFFHLSPYFRRNFSIAAIFYIGGALGFEIAEGWYKDTLGVKNANNFFKPSYQVLTTFEEAFEMIGIIIFIYSLLKFINIYFKEIEIQVGDPLEENQGV